MRSQRDPAQTRQQLEAPANGRRAKRIVYPYSDGKPMAESPEHIDELIHCLLILRDYYAADARVYVGADMFLYYERGNPSAAVAPDLFVAKGVSKTRRRTSYRLWEERAVPNFVLELTSPSTAAEDRHKAEVYGRLGVREYLLYDPRPEACEGPSAARDLLQGYRLGANGYQPIATEATGGLVSEELGLRVVLEGDQLQWYDMATGVRLLDPRERAEVEAAARRQAESRTETEAAARREAEARLAELEALLRQPPPPPQI